MHPATWPLRTRIVVVVGISLSLLIACVAAIAGQNWVLGQVQHQPVADALAGPTCDGQTFSSVAQNLSYARHRLDVSTNESGNSTGPEPAWARYYLTQARQQLTPEFTQDPALLEYALSLEAASARISDDLSAALSDEARLKSLQAQLDERTAKAKQMCERLYSDATAITPRHLRLAFNVAEYLAIITVVWFGSLIGLGFAGLRDKVKAKFEGLTRHR